MSRLLVSDVTQNYAKPKQKVVPQSLTFPELCAAIYGTVRQTAPTWVPLWSIEARIHDLWTLGPPDLGRAGARWLLPGPMQQLAKEIAQEVGAQVLKGG